MALDVVGVSEQSTTNGQGAIQVTLSVSVTGYGAAVELAKLLGRAVNVMNAGGEIVDSALVSGVGGKYYPADDVVEGTAKLSGGPALQRVVGRRLKLEVSQLGLGLEVEKAVENLRPKKGSGIDSVTISDTKGHSATLKPREEA